MRYVTYGIGGYDETKPNNNIIEEIELPDEADQAEVQRQELPKLE